MARTEAHVNSPLGLDIGTSRIVLAQRADNIFEFKSQLNAFTVIPYSKLTEGILNRESIPHTVDASRIVVYGNEAARFADLAHIETRRPMVNGVLNPEEPDGLALIRKIIETLTGTARGEGRSICISVPAAPAAAGENVTYHESALRDLLAGMGYKVQSITEGLAVVYAELEDTNYTGVGISFGGGMCNVTFAYLSVPVTSFSVPKAGDFVDRSAATATGENATRVRMLKEQSFKFNGSFADRIHQAVAVYYDDIIQTVIKTMSDAFASARMLPALHRPIPLVVSGGSAVPHGFCARFESILKQKDFPIPISEIRMAADPLHSTAKGTLVAAISET